MNKWQRFIWLILKCKTSLLWTALYLFAKLFLILKRCQPSLKWIVVSSNLAIFLLFFQPGLQYFWILLVKFICQRPWKSLEESNKHWLILDSLWTLHPTWLCTLCSPLATPRLRCLTKTLKSSRLFFLLCFFRWMRWQTEQFGTLFCRLWKKLTLWRPLPLSRCKF